MGGQAPVSSTSRNALPRIRSGISALKPQQLPMPANRWADLVPGQLSVHRPQHSVVHGVVEVLACVMHSRIVPQA